MPLYTWFYYTIGQNLSEGHRLCVRPRTSPCVGFAFGLFVSGCFPVGRASSREALRRKVGPTRRGVGLLGGAVLCSAQEGRACGTPERTPGMHSAMQSNGHEGPRAGRDPAPPLRILAISKAGSEPSGSTGWIHPVFY